MASSKGLGTALAAAILLGVPTMAAGGEADVLDVNVRRSVDATYRFTVTIRHGDEGWDHYADRFEVLDDDGEVLGVRTLHHPHVEEQPFTRSLAGVEIPPGVAEVRVRARDTVHGYGGKAISLPLPP